MKFKRILPILAVTWSLLPCTGRAADRNRADATNASVVESAKHDSGAHALVRDIMADFGARLGHISDEPQGPSATGIETDTVRVSVVRSRVPNENRFEYLNDEWANYGSMPVVIDLMMADDTFINEQLLRDKAPHVICIASPVAAGQIYSNSEVGILRQLQAEGTQIVVVGVALGSDGPLDNRVLGELIGINVDAHNYQRGTTADKFEPFMQSDLLQGLPQGPFDMPDQMGNETPVGDKWTNDHLLADTERVAMSEDGVAIETIYSSSGGDGIYISYTLEYGGVPLNPEDENATQLFYNMLTYGFSPPGKPVAGSTSVDGEPFANRPLFLARKDIGCDRKTRTDDDGFYTFEGVPPGTYALEIPNIVDNRDPGQDAIIIASGYLEIDNEPTVDQRVFGVRIDIFPFDVEGPDITDENGLWELSLPSTGRWVVYAPGIGVVAKD